MTEFLYFYIMMGLVAVLIQHTRMLFPKRRAKYLGKIAKMRAKEGWAPSYAVLLAITGLLWWLFYAIQIAKVLGYIKEEK